MASLDLLRHRLFNQRLTQPQLATPAEVVAWFGAVQAQEYLGATWSLGQRMLGATEAALDAAFNAAEIVRTHVMRPTWHFVAPADLRWLLALTGPRVHALNGTMYRRGKLDADVLTRSHAVLATSLSGGRYLTRNELGEALKQAGIERAGQDLAYIMIHAELEGLICSGPRRGKQFTYALLEERVLPAPPLDRDGALAELTRRYFHSHGPATPHDFAWWSGLTVSDARAGLEMTGSLFEREVIDGREFWYAPAQPPAIPKRAYLLPTYDEYGIAYRDRRDFYNPDDAGKPEAGVSAGFAYMIVIGGRVVGLWRREVSKTTVTITTQWWREATPANLRAFAAAARQYGAFLGLDTVIM